MIMMGMTFRSWLLCTTIAYPPRALARMSFSKATLKGITEQVRADRAEFESRQPI